MPLTPWTATKLPDIMGPDEATWRGGKGVDSWYGKAGDDIGFGALGEFSLDPMNETDFFSGGKLYSGLDSNWDPQGVFGPSADYGYVNIYDEAGKPWEGNVAFWDEQRSGIEQTGGFAAFSEAACVKRL